jgi:Flp pilus assembly protein TadD
LAYPEDVELLKMMGLMASRKGDHRYAVQLLSEALTAEPNNAELHFKLGASLFALKRYDEARVALEKAIALSPQSKFVPEARRMLQVGKAG